MSGRLQLVAVIVLGLLAVLAVVGAVVLTLADKSVPDFLVAVGSGAAGGVGGALTLGKAPADG